MREKNILISRSTGWALADPDWKGKGWADVRHEIDYLAEVQIGAIIEIFGQVVDFGRTSITGLLEIHTNHKPAARLSLKTVFVDLNARKSVPLSPEMIARLSAKASKASKESAS